MASYFKASKTILPSVASRSSTKKPTVVVRTNSNSSSSTRPAATPSVSSEGLFCRYLHRPCMQNRVEGYEYCLHHILEDKTCPFKQCSFSSGKSGKRCPRAVTKIERKDSYCPDHMRKMHHLRLKANKKTTQKLTAETLLEDLEQYIKPSVERSRGGGDGPSLNQSIKTRIGIEASRILESQSSDVIESEQLLVDNVWRGDHESDAESVDSEQEDVLKHAGVYTAEEVALATRDKMIHLQSLYIEQFKRLQHVLKEQWGLFHQECESEKAKFGQVQPNEDSEMLAKYVALKRYHKRYGKEALLYKQSKARRIAHSEGVGKHPPILLPVCIHMEGRVNCKELALPLSKFCLQHILHDPQQVLYQPCTYGNGACGQSVAGVTDSPRCDLHTPLVAMERRIHTITEDKDSPLVRDLEQDPQDAYIGLGDPIAMDLGLSSLLT